MILTAAGERLTWLEWRRGGLGSSDAAAIAGLDPYRGPMSVWLDKTGRRRGERAEDEWQRWGHLLEPVIIAEFEHTTGLHVTARQRLVEHPQHPWMRATVDGLVVEQAVVEAFMAGVEVDAPDSGFSPLGVLEVKTVVGFKSAAWGTPDAPQVPDHFWLQVQHQLAVTGFDQAWLAVLFGGQHLEVRNVDRDEADIAALVKLEQAFWERHVLADEPPVGDGMAATTAALQAAWPDAEPPVDLPDQAELLIRERQAAKAEVVAATARQEAAEQALMAMLGGSEVGLFDGRPVVTWKHHRRAESVRTIAAGTYRQLRFVGRPGEEE